MGIIMDADKLLASKVKGKRWAELSLPVLVGIKKELSDVDATKEKEKDDIDPGMITRLQLAEVDTKHAGEIAELKIKDDAIRERVMKEYTDTETIAGDAGELVFPQTTGFKVVDIRKVEQKFLMVDGKAVKAEIKAGVVKIRGISVEKVRGLQVRPRKE